MLKKKDGKWGWKRFLILCIAIAALVALAGWLISRALREPVELEKLGKYLDLKVDAKGAEAEDAIVKAVVERAKFGSKLDDRVEDEYRQSMDYFAREAEYFQMELGAYLQKNYGMDEKTFRKKVRATAEDTIKESLVLLAIAEKEHIEITSEEFEEAMPILMEAYGYSDRNKFIQDVDLEALRVELLQEKVIEFLLAHNTVENAKPTTQ